MRVLFTTQPGTGHLLPLLPVAAGLRQRGHEVAFASAASFGAEIATAGYPHFPVGRDWLTVGMAAAFPDMAAIPPGPERYAWARSTLFAGRTARRAMLDVVALAADWKPDLVVRDAAEYSGCLAAEYLGLPHAMVRTDSGSSSYGDRHHVAAALTANRARLGLPPDPDVTMPFRYLQLSFAPPALDEPEEQTAPTCHRLRPVEPPASGEPPAWLRELADRPTVYATLGTVYNGTELLTAILDGLAPEPLNLIMTVGPTQDPQRFGARPPHIRIEHWIPQEHLLPHCHAVVTHGGYGTASAALTHGLPLVMIPISADQPMNAARCTARGVALTLPPDRRDPEAIRAATRAVLGDPAHRRAARQAARAARQRPDLDHALDLLETLARERSPLVRSRAA